MLDHVSLLVDEALGTHHLEGVVDGVQRWLGRPVRAKVVVGPRKVLTVIDGKVHVVQRVVRRAVDELFRPMARNHVAVVDEDGPDLDGDEEDQVQISLHGADEDEDAFRILEKVFWRVEAEGYSLVWQRLHEAIKRVESQRSPWCGHCCH